jgi:DNA-directed RNA polymerase specialized sigma24 family protein
MSKTNASSEKKAWSNEKELIEAMSRGSDAAWRYVYKDNWPSISVYVLAQGGSDDDAKEVHQVAMTTLYDKLHILTVSIKTFAFAVAKYTWWAMNKKRGKMIPYEPNPVYNGDGENEDDPLDDLGVIGTDGVENPFDSSELPSIDEVLDYIKTIDNPCRDLLLDHYIGQIKYEELAEETNEKSGTLRQRANRCLDRVKQHFLNRSKNK